MAKHTVFWSSNLRATHFAERIMDAVCDEDIDNGTFGYLEEQVESHVYKFVKGFKAGSPVVVASNPEWDYDECRITNQRKDNFYIKAGTRFRVFFLHLNDEFAVSIEGITSATQKTVTDVTDFMANDVFLTIDGTTGKLVASATTTKDAVMEARIERKHKIGNTLITAAHTYGSSNDMYEARIKVLV